MIPTQNNQYADLFTKIQKLHSHEPHRLVVLPQRQAATLRRALLLMMQSHRVTDYHW